MDKVLVVSVHPDDETLGCGGALLKHKASGDQIYWLNITDINESDGWDKSKVALRKNEIKKVSELYSFNKSFNLGFPTINLDKIPINEIISRISEVFYEIKPTKIYLINRSDIHSDHKIAFQAIISCTKNFRYPYIKKVLMYECLSETEFTPPFPETVFQPNVFIDITDFIDQKLEIMKIYSSEVMEEPLPRSIYAIKALASYRGSRISVKYAEAFQLIFEIM